MTTIKKMFDLANDLSDNGKLKDSAKVWLKILDEYCNDTRSQLKAYYGLSSVYFDLKEYDKALEIFKKQAEIDPTSEIASLGLYVTYIELGRDEEGIHELIKYLKKYPADLYKDTLEELLEGLKEDS